MGALGLPVLGVPVVFGGGGGVLYYIDDAISITPSAGSELITNGDFSAWTGDDPDGWIVGSETPGSIEITERGPLQGYAGGGGGAACIYNSPGTSFIVRQRPLTVGRFFVGSVDMTNYVGGALQWYWSGGDISHPIFNMGAAVTLAVTLVAVDDWIWLRVQDANTDVTIDDVSYKQLSNTMQLTDHAQPYGDFSVWLTRTAYHVGGVVFNYTDDDNFAVVFNRGDDKLVLLSWVSGTPTIIGTWSYTYAADAKLTARRHIDGTIDIIYNGATIVSGLSATGLTGTQAGAMLLSASEVSISAYEWDARTTT